VFIFSEMRSCAEQRLLVLDPSENSSPLAGWNTVIEISPVRRKFPSRAWGQSGEFRCVLETAIAVEPKQCRP